MILYVVLSVKSYHIYYITKLLPNCSAYTPNKHDAVDSCLHNSLTLYML